MPSIHTHLSFLDIDSSCFVQINNFKNSKLKKILYLLIVTTIEYHKNMRAYRPLPARDKRLDEKEKIQDESLSLLDEKLDLKFKK